MSLDSDDCDDEFTIEQYEQLFESNRTSGIDISQSPENGQLDQAVDILKPQNLNNNSCSSSVDSDIDGNDDETITFSAITSLEVSYRGKCLNVYYLDLDEDEYDTLVPVKETSVSLEISQRDILISDDLMLCIKRISINSDISPVQYAHSHALAKESSTERILFSTDGQLMAKYRNEIYFVDKSLADEYKFLLSRSGRPMGTPIRIRKDRILVNNFEHILSVAKRAGQFRTNQEIIVLTPPKNYDGIEEASLGNCNNFHLQDVSLEFDRYLCDACGDLYKVDRKLLFSDCDGYCVELYGEPDYRIDEDERVCKVDPRFNRQELKMAPLQAYNASKEVAELVDHNFTEKPGFEFSTEAKKLMQYIHKLQKQQPATRLTKDTYIVQFKHLIEFEDEAQQLYIATFNRKNIRVKHEHNKFYYFAVTKFTKELVVGVDEGKLFNFVLIPMSQLHVPPNSRIKQQRYFGTVIRSHEDKIYLELLQKLNSKAENDLYYIEFICNRTPQQMEHQAMQFVLEHKLSEFLFPNLTAVNHLTMDNLTAQMENLNIRKIESELTDKKFNSEQITAIKCILSETSRPYPYILFGPPGTGKTKTLVGAIEYVVQMNDYALVCATSNSACDEICSRLLKVLPKGVLYRLYSSSVRSEFVDRDLKKISNLAGDYHYFPPLNELYEYRVICCTLTTAGRLVQARADKNVFDARHFNYVFIDECGSATESTALIPIAGLCTCPGSIEATIVLAGDPKQLGPIVQSQIAAQLGYDSSLLERLMNLDIYKRNPTTKKFNDKFITQLLCNYRSHPAILKVPNKLFYEDVLIPKASQHNIDWFLHTNLLPNGKFPIIFAQVAGKCLKDEDDPSYFNMKEVNKVMYYLDRLLSQKFRYQNARRYKRKITIDDIGIISPYKKQCKKIRAACRRRGWDGIQTGSVEVFQGKEKPIIIVSLVRSDGHKIGFLNNPKRMNVLLTRAKCLLIIIGDSETLSTDENWLEVIGHSLENNGFAYE